MNIEIQYKFPLAGQILANRPQVQNAKLISNKLTGGKSSSNNS